MLRALVEMLGAYENELNCDLTMTFYIQLHRRRREELTGYIKAPWRVIQSNP